MGVVLRAPRVPRGGNGGGTGRGNEGRTWESSAPTPTTGEPSTGECNAVLVSWNRQKRFGFVEVELGGSPRKVFLHRSALGGAPPPIGSALRVSIQAKSLACPLISSSRLPPISYIINYATLPVFPHVAHAVLLHVTFPLFPISCFPHESSSSFISTSSSRGTRVEGSSAGAQELRARPPPRAMRVPPLTAPPSRVAPRMASLIPTLIPTRCGFNASR